MKKLAIIAVLTTISLSTLMGCGNKNSASNQSVSQSASSQSLYGYVFNVDGYDVTVEEFNHYLIQALSCYQIQSTDMPEDIQQQFIDETEDEIRLEILIEEYAISKGTVLDDETKKKVADNTNMFVSYYQNTLLKEYNIDEALVEKYFNRIAIITTYEAKVEAEYKEQYLKQLREEVTSDKFCSFDLLSFETEEKANEFLKSAPKDAGYQAIIDKANSDATCEVTSDKGIYGGFDNEDENNALEGLEDGKLSAVIKMNDKYVVILMKNSKDEEFYNQTIEYIASESAKQSYAQEIDAYLKEKNIPEVNISEESKAYINPGDIYSKLCAVEMYKQ